MQYCVIDFTTMIMQDFIFFPKLKKFIEWKEAE